MAVIALKECRSYDSPGIERAVESALSGALGDDTGPIRGKRVLIKPNLLAAREPARGVTTHPAVVGGVIDFFRAHGAEVAVGDSPAGAVRGVKRVWENTGMLDLCEARRVPLVNFEASGCATRRVDGRDYPIAGALSDYDLVASVPKLKGHVLTLITAAIKNVFGCVPGFQKSALHLEHPRPGAMSRVLVDVFSIVRPWVTLVDAVEAMEGDGPSSGSLRNLNFIAASRDCVALDACLSRIVGVDPEQVPTTREALRRRLGEASAESMVFPLLRPEDLAVDDFRVPGNWKYKLIPGVAAALLRRLVWVLPAIDAGKCTGCGDCVRVCAAGAMSLEHGRAVVKESLCVSCLCCHEACPHFAVGTRMSRLARLLA
jgi:uncharacterized protein (DUF362 family)/Pyruvate/2-oxoacid:ferredoxin oxidoreductase delta subunit